MGKVLVCSRNFFLGDNRFYRGIFFNLATFFGYAHLSQRDSSIEIDQSRSVWISEEVRDGNKFLHEFSLRSADIVKQNWKSRIGCKCKTVNPLENTITSRTREIFERNR